MSGNFRGNDNRNSGNHNGSGTQVFGDNNHIWVYSRDGRAHQTHVEDRHPTPVTDRLTFWFNLIMTLCAVGSLMLGTLQLAASGRQSETAGHSSLSMPLVIMFALTGVLAGLGWMFRSWLRRRLYGNGHFLGLVPEGRQDASGRFRMYLTRLRGVCAIDGAPMQPRWAPAETETTFYSDGSRKTRVTRHELQMVCTRNGRDNGHRGRVDVADTEE